MFEDFSEEEYYAKQEIAYARKHYPDVYAKQQQIQQDAQIEWDKRYEREREFQHQENMTANTLSFKRGPKHSWGRIIYSQCQLRNGCNPPDYMD